MGGEEVMGRKVLWLSGLRITVKGGESKSAILMLLGSVTKQCDRREFGDENEHKMVVKERRET